MENLSISDAPPGALGAGPQPPAQLPPQMFTTAAQLLDLTDKKLMLSLRDGRKLIGVLRSWDQFANLVLQSTTERIFVPRPDARAGDGGPLGFFADVPHGVFLVRGENVLLLGEIDLDRDDDAPAGYERADLALVRRLAEDKKAADRARDKTRLRRLAKIGFEGEGAGDMVL